MKISEAFLFQLCIFLLASGTLSRRNGIARKKHREGKLFSLFNIVKFKNEICPSLSNAGMSGTCFSSSECSSLSGSADGSCASGFGVCCLFMITACSGTVTQNCTFIQNAGFPRDDTSGTSLCTYNFDRISNDVTQIRLDFVDVVTNANGPNPGACGGTADALTVLSPFSTSSAAFPPVVCGTLTGQHMYFETGSTGTTSGSLQIAKGTTPNFARRYKIKVTYIGPHSTNRAPQGCTQFFTEMTGTITSYNFAGSQLLENQYYSNCIRRRSGFCSYQVMSTNPTSFILSGAFGSEVVKDKCQGNNHVAIPHDNRIILSNPGNPGKIIAESTRDFRCDRVFGLIPGSMVPSALKSDPHAPLTLAVRTLKSTDNGNAALLSQTGFSLDYTLLPC